MMMKGGAAAAQGEGALIHRLFPEIENVMVGAVLLMLLRFVVRVCTITSPRDGFNDEVCKQLLARNEDEGRPRLLGS